MSPISLRGSISITSKKPRPSLGFDPLPVEIRRAEDLEPAFAVLRGRAHAMYVCSADPLVIDDRARIMAESGVTEAELCAKVLRDNSATVLMFERMIGARERDRRKLRKEDERRQRQARQKD